MNRKSDHAVGARSISSSTDSFRRVLSAVVCIYRSEHAVVGNSVVVWYRGIRFQHCACQSYKHHWHCCAVGVVANPPHFRQQLKNTLSASSLRIRSRMRSASCFGPSFINVRASGLLVLYGSKNFSLRADRSRSFLLRQRRPVVPDAPVSP